MAIMTTLGMGSANPSPSPSQPGWRTCQNLRHKREQLLSVRESLSHRTGSPQHQFNPDKLHQAARSDGDRLGAACLSPGTDGKLGEEGAASCTGRCSPPRDGAGGLPFLAISIPRPFMPQTSTSDAWNRESIARGERGGRGGDVSLGEQDGHDPLDPVPLGRWAAAQPRRRGASATG